MVNDWKIIDLPGILSRKVENYDAQGCQIPDDGEWHRRVAEMYYILAEFLVTKALIADNIDITRRPDLVILHSQLTERGQAFEKFAIHKWVASIDRVPLGKPITADGLERQWVKFTRATL